MKLSINKQFHIIGTLKIMCSTIYALTNDEKNPTTIMIYILCLCKKTHSKMTREAISKTKSARLVSEANEILR